MDTNNTHSPNTESESRPSAVKTLRRFFFVAWHVSPFGAIAQALLTLVHGCIPIGILWASRGLVNLITAILAKETEPSLETAAPWIIALVLLATVRNVVGTCDGYLRWKIQNHIKVHQQHALLEATTHIDFAVFDQPQTYDLIQRARQALDHRLTNFLQISNGDWATLRNARGVRCSPLDRGSAPRACGRVTRNPFRLAQS